jgi:hypothetical protein
MQEVTFSDISTELKARKWPQTLNPKEANKITTAIILRFMSLKYKDFSTHIDVVRNKERESNTVMEIFRYPFVTYLTQSTFESLSQFIELQNEWISEARKPDEIDLEIYFYVIKILHANL